METSCSVTARSAVRGERVNGSTSLTPLNRSEGYRTINAMTGRWTDTRVGISTSEEISEEGCVQTHTDVVIKDKKKLGLDTFWHANNIYCL